MGESIFRLINLGSDVLKLDELYEKRVVIINVGMSTQDGIPGPIFDGGTFKFIPIPDSKSNKRLPTYEEMGLGKWAPNPLARVHNDPEFETMTFGDYKYTESGKRNIRVANALNLRPDDFLFFFASLSTLKDRDFRKTTGFYLIGYFEIEQILPYKDAKTSPVVRKNAHRLRNHDSGYTIWKGTERSSLLKYAIPMNQRNINKFLRTSNGELLPWNSFDKTNHKRTRLEVINSATRASRLIKKKFRSFFWNIVIDKNPNLPIFER